MHRDCTCRRRIVLQKLAIPPSPRILVLSKSRSLPSVLAISISPSSTASAVAARRSPSCSCRTSGVEREIHVDKGILEIQEMAALCSSLAALSLSFTPPRVSNAPANAAHGGALQCQAGAALRLERASRDVAVVRWPARRVERLSSWPCGARRKSSGATKTEVEVLDDEDLRAGLNETVTEALKVMLAEDDKMLETFKDKVDFLGEFLVQDGQTEAARFMLILRGMLDHEVYPQNEELQGPYKRAFNTLWCLLEDSGWLLKQPGAEIPEVDDDEPGEPDLEIRFS